MKIGVLDIQGSVEEHCVALAKCEMEVMRVKKPEDLADLAGLILPGGESTTMGKLLWRFELAEEILRSFEAGNLAIWGTCAGCILLEGLGLMDIEVERNAYGSQLDSFETEVWFGGQSEGGNVNSERRDASLCRDCARLVPSVFIRAPKITGVGREVEILAYRGEEIVACREGKLMATTFHPELTNDLQIHKYFIEELCGE